MGEQPPQSRRLAGDGAGVRANQWVTRWCCFSPLSRRAGRCWAGCGVARPLRCAAHAATRRKSHRRGRAFRMEQGFGDPGELQKAAGSRHLSLLGAVQPRQRSASAPSTSHARGHPCRSGLGWVGVTWLWGTQPHGPGRAGGPMVVAELEMLSGSQRAFCLQRTRTVIVPRPSFSVGCTHCSSF